MFFICETLMNRTIDSSFLFDLNRLALKVCCNSIYDSPESSAARQRAARAGMESLRNPLRGLPGLREGLVGRATNFRETHPRLLQRPCCYAIREFRDTERSQIHTKMPPRRFEQAGFGGGGFN